jgi:hypothetical protein
VIGAPTRFFIPSRTVVLSVDKSELVHIAGLKHQRKPRQRYTTVVLNSIIGVLVLLVGYYAYGYFSSKNSPPPPIEQPKPQKIIQVDVLNGCGLKGIAAKFTNYLRSHGVDVVETQNYKTFQVSRTLVVDRVGNLASARYIAMILGIDSTNVIQQLNPDYFVDVSVIIGLDYSSLPIAQQ